MNDHRDEDGDRWRRWCETASPISRSARAPQMDPAVLEVPDDVSGQNDRVVDQEADREDSAISVITLTVIP